MVGLAVRLAQMLGLNKDPSHFPTIDPATAETRRRIWWYLFYVDVNVAAAAGLPTLVEDQSWDVDPISEAESHLPYAREAPASISGLYVVGKYRDAGE